MSFAQGFGTLALDLGEAQRGAGKDRHHRPRLNFRLTDPNGAFDYSVQETDADAPATGTTILIEFGGDVPAGEWTLTISSDSLAAPAVDYEGSTTVRYGA